MQPIIEANVEKGGEVHSDEWHAYKGLSAKGYVHKTVEHGAGEYVGPTGVTVNSIEGFWGQLKRSISGTHIHVSGKHLWKYAREAEYRFNRRDCASSMLPELLSTFRPLPPKSN
jgi:transposase